MPRTARRTVSLIAVHVCALALVGCGMAKGHGSDSDSGNAVSQAPLATSSTASTASGGSCDARTVAPYVPDNSPTAIVPGGTDDPSLIVTLLRDKGHIPPSSLLVSAAIPPIGSHMSVDHAVICPSGDVYDTDEHKRLTAKPALLLTRQPNGSDDRTLRIGNDDGTIYYAHPAGDVLTAPCPALASYLGEPDDPYYYLRAICLDNLDPVLPPGI